ncbi:GNAT family N-acetyltransferase [Streptomyces cupreus]|uniref:GNAT family N-acetyltransferase n=1 Tax=Streptomyces cupreus TaxID=2759956 RepID=A0A7X1MEP6_9ACTN|nr:GNAT family N-acetyltransferase [Streptomyces cupreus]MBC2908256.1 GNAT family N-acetyltransferase [Streptomyces cupreus]
MVVYVSPVPGVSLRPYTPADRAAVLELVNADRLPGQPAATPAMLADAVRGRSRVDAGWWAELACPTTTVATSAAGTVLGVVSYALRPKDGHGVILWLHCREDESVARALLDRAGTELGTRTLDAFHFATALTLGVEALPAGHRPATHAALTAAGYTGVDLWRYMHRTLPAPELPRLTRYDTEPATPDTRRLLVTEDGKTLADATIGTPVQGTGVVWWIGVQPAARGQGTGRALLGTALHALSRMGAADVILFVDDAPPGGDRDRTAAKALYESSGFEEIDRLYSFTKQSR